VVLSAVSEGSAPRIAAFNILKKAALIPETMTFEEYMAETAVKDAKKETTEEGAK
jgi:hypothetical protein